MILKQYRNRTERKSKQ